MLVTLSGIIIESLFPPGQVINVVFSLLNKIPLTPEYTELLALTSMLVKTLHWKNAEEPMFVTLFPIVTLVSLLQPLNTETPMLVTLSGTVMLVIFVRDAKARLPIETTE